MKWEDRPELLTAGCEEGIRETGSFVIRDSKSSIARMIILGMALFWIQLHSRLVKLVHFEAMNCILMGMTLGKRGLRGVRCTIMAMIWTRMIWVIEIRGWRIGMQPWNKRRRCTSPPWTGSQGLI